MSAAAITATQLQQLFGHAGIANVNAYSQHIFHRLHLCHTAAMGMHHYRCDDKKCSHLHLQALRQLRRVKKRAVDRKNIA